MRASTVRCRFLDRCGDSLGVESSFFRIFVYSQWFFNGGCGGFILNVIADYGRMFTV